jgi:hypothetical protein
MTQTDWALSAYMRGYYLLDRLADKQLHAIATFCRSAQGGRLPTGAESLNASCLRRLAKAGAPASQVDAQKNKRDSNALLDAVHQVLMERDI